MSPVLEISEKVKLDPLEIVETETFYHLYS